MFEAIITPDEPFKRAASTWHDTLESLLFNLNNYPDDMRLIVSVDYGDDWPKSYRGSGRTIATQVQSHAKGAS